MDPAVYGLSGPYFKQRPYNQDTLELGHDLDPDARCFLIVDRICSNPNQKLSSEGLPMRGGTWRVSSSIEFDLRRSLKLGKLGVLPTWVRGHSGIESGEYRAWSGYPHLACNDPSCFRPSKKL